MKKLLKYLNIALLFFALSAVFTACSDDENNGPGNVGLNIKVFSPTLVVPGQQMTINGSGFDNVTEIIFPGDISVTNFRIITNEMIRVVAPQGLSQEGHIMVRNAAGETAVSNVVLTIGNSQISGYSAQEGDLLKGNETFTVYGKDMQFISGAEFIDEEGNPLFVPASEFIRVAPGRAVIQVPAKVQTECFPVTLFFGNQTFKTPIFAFETAKEEGGHWEISKRYLWKNGEHSTIPAPSWSGEGRFASVSHSTGEETYAFSEEDWEFIKTQPFRIEIEKLADWVNLRVTTGWWSTNYMGLESLNDLVTEDEDGNFYVEINLQDDAALLGAIDEQHLLFTGQDYKLLGIYVEDKVWVEGEGGHLEVVRESFWKNGEHSTIPEPTWSGEGRFASASHSTGEETWAFSDEEWEILKSEPFRIAIEKTADWSNIRVTTGWWSTNYLGMENIQELIEENEDGSLFIEINLANDPALLALIDEQHLLFTGDGYKLLEIYQEKEVWVGGGDGASQEVVIWENDGSSGEISWDGVYRFSNKEKSTGEEIYAIPMDQWDVIKNGTFYLVAKGSDWVQMRITTGWWSTTWTGADITTGDERIIDNGDGTFTLEINFSGDPILDLLDDQHLLLTGGGYTPLKLYYK